MDKINISAEGFQESSFFQSKELHDLLGSFPDLIFYDYISPLKIYRLYLAQGGIFCHHLDNVWVMSQVAATFLH